MSHFTVSALILYDLIILLFYTVPELYFMIQVQTGRSYSKMSMVSGLKVH